MESAWQLFLNRLSSPDSEFTYDDVCGWTAEEFEALSGAGLINETTPATHVVCDACSEVHWERVRWSEDGKRAFIACSVAGTVDVPLERLRRWKGSPTQLSVLLAQALSPSQEVQALPASRIWFLGRSRAAGRTPYFFFSAIGPDELSSAMHEIRQAYGNITSVLLLSFSPPVPGGTTKVKTVDLRIIASLRIGGISVDFDSIEDQFSDDLGHQGSQVKNASRSLVAHHRIIVKAYMKKNGLDGVKALARRLGVSVTALHGIIRGDTTRYSADKLDSVLKEIGCPLAKWDRAAKPTARA